MTDAPSPGSDRSRRSRWRGIVGLAARRALVRGTATDRQQTTLSILGVAVSVALMLVVTSVGVGLAQSSSIGGPDVDYTIVPEGAGSTVMGVDGARLGRVHPVAARLAARDDVAYVTPIRTALLRVRAGSGEPTYVLAIGIIPSASRDAVVGLDTAGLIPGDPHYGDGDYDGPWTGQAVLSTAAADALDAGPGDRLVPEGRPGTDRNFTVSAVSEPRRAGVAQFPVALVHLGELQSLAGGADADAADQIVVVTRADLGNELSTIYPRSRVLTQRDLFAGAGAGASELPLAISLAAFVVGVAVGTLFVMTTLGFEIAAERRERAVLAAIGVSRPSRVMLVVVETLAIALLGGIAGIALWLVGVTAANALATRFLTEVPIAAVRPVFAAYGLGVALLIGLLAVPYLLLLSRHTVSTETLLS